MPQPSGDKQGTSSPQRDGFVGTGLLLALGAFLGIRLCFLH